MVWFSQSRDLVGLGEVLSPFSSSRGIYELHATRVVDSSSTDVLFRPVEGVCMRPSSREKSRKGIGALIKDIGAPMVNIHQMW